MSFVRRKGGLAVMKALHSIGVVAAVSIIVVTCKPADGGPEGFSPYVDASGAIRLPGNFRDEWTFIGTWSIAAGKEVSAAAMGHGSGSAGFHNVYTQPETVRAYRKTGEFPDGAVLVKELLKGETAQMTTGTASWGDQVEGWFVMVKDTEGRFEGNSLWGVGWGWALFDEKDPMKPVTKDFRTECLGCHIPARETDWIYIQGYPLLRE